MTFTLFSYKYQSARINYKLIPINSLYPLIMSTLKMKNNMNTNDTKLVQDGNVKL